jgi:hypothetical protein
MLADWVQNERKNAILSPFPEESISLIKVWHLLLFRLIYWIDVYQSDGNLLASGGMDKNIKIYDRRESKIVKTFDGIHSGKKYKYYLLFQQKQNKRTHCLIWYYTILFCFLCFINELLWLFIFRLPINNIHNILGKWGDVGNCRYYGFIKRKWKKKI